VLVQETQANFDYTFGRSSAFLDRPTIEGFEKLFQEVWSSSATGVTATKKLEEHIDSFKD